MLFPQCIHHCSTDGIKHCFAIILYPSCNQSTIHITWYWFNYSSINTIDLCEIHYICVYIAIMFTECLTKNIIQRFNPLKMVHFLGAFIHLFDHYAITTISSDERCLQEILFGTTCAVMWSSGLNVPTHTDVLTLPKS